MTGQYAVRNMNTTLQSLGARFRTLLAPTSGVNPNDLADPDPTVRWRAVHALVRQQPQNDLLPQVFQLLKDPDPTIRYETVLLLSAWGPEPDTLQPAVELLASNPPAETTITLLDLFSHVPLPAAHTLVQDRLTHDDPQVRAAAANALGIYDEHEDVERLAPLTDDPIPEVRRAACLALAEINDPTVPGVLRQHLRDPDPLTRQIVQQALDQHQNKTSTAQD